MFRAAHRLPIEYRDPWNADFADRLQAMIARPRRIAYFFESPDTSTFRYRVFNMVQALAGAFQGETSAAWFHKEDLDKMESFVDRADALVLCRARYRQEIDRMLLRARACGVRILYDVDDLVFDPAYVTLVLDTLNRT